jgi:hypothetical protein
MIEKDIHRFQVWPNRMIDMMFSPELWCKKFDSDHGLHGFKRYVSLAILARNLQIIGLNA